MGCECVKSNFANSLPNEEWKEIFYNYCKLVGGHSPIIRLYEALPPKDTKGKEALFALLSDANQSAFSTLASYVDDAEIERRYRVLRQVERSDHSLHFLIWMELKKFRQVYPSIVNKIKKEEEEEKTK